MSYFRVIPRDLFNEAKLLKCMGQLSLKIEDKQAPKGLTLVHNFEEKGFPIRQNPDSGGIYVSRGVLTLIYKDVVLHLETGLNSRMPYPLTVETMDGNTAFVFDDNGEFSEEFLDLLKELD